MKKINNIYDRLLSDLYMNIQLYKQKEEQI